MTRPLLSVEALEKRFTLHLQGGLEIPVLDGLGFSVRPGECVVLAGASGVGKSTVLKLVYGSYKASAGRVLVSHEGAPVDLVSADPRTVLDVRRRTLGYVSQFLRVVPRVAAIDVVAEPLVTLGMPREEARERAGTLLDRLAIPERLFSLPPATFSGGEQQRVNIARGFAHPYPVLLLDEPTASLDARNRATVVQLIEEAKARGAAMVGIFHDEDVREAVATRLVDLTAERMAA
ncbi:phosphonate C-P lyase system protein PhnL [Marinimicrococcus flavescens]|uniref:Phosphonate C-P lyase system protein PhnL n=1 Tax=Marinimicrococcus flavescens TaxID=3031815 RepID=A0AAP3V2Q8_9PROT|nr:phosphonate C-P lyase system protein PhnL [Marinimicrococcus flavescens]